jgi:hypothetical protein
VRQLCLLAAVLAGCAHADPPAALAPGREPACVAASMVVLRAAQGLVDPVETEREILSSSALRQSMEKIAPLSRLSSLCVARRGKSAVLSLTAAAPEKAAALATCSAALDAAFAFGKEGLQFLQEQERSMALDLEVQSRVLRELELAHDFSTVPAGDQLARCRERLSRAQHELDTARRREPGLETALLTAHAEVERLSELEAEWRRRGLEVEETRERLRLLRTRLAEASVTGILQQDLRVLDGCQPCPR